MLNLKKIRMVQKTWKIRKIYKDCYYYIGMTNYNLASILSNISLDGLNPIAQAQVPVRLLKSFIGSDSQISFYKKDDLYVAKWESSATIYAIAKESNPEIEFTLFSAGVINHISIDEKMKSGFKIDIGEKDYCRGQGYEYRFEFLDRKVFYYGPDGKFDVYYRFENPHHVQVEKSKSFKREFKQYLPQKFKPLKLEKTVGMTQGDKPTPIIEPLSNLSEIYEAIEKFYSQFTKK